MCELIAQIEKIARIDVTMIAGDLLVVAKVLVVARTETFRLCFQLWLILPF
jgi:hypothetical protein